MSRIKNFKIIQFEKLRVESGFVDIENPKAIYLRTSAQYKSLTDEPVQDIKRFIFKVRQTISRKLESSIFHKRFLYDTDTPDVLAETNEGFINMEFTLYLNDKYNVDYVEKSVNKLISDVYNENYISTENITIRKRQKQCQEQE